MKRGDAILAVALGLVLLAGHAVATGTVPSWLRGGTADANALAPVPIAVFNEAMEVPIKAFSYAVFDSHFAAMYGRTNAKWVRISEAVETCVVPAEALKPGCLILVHVDGFRDCGAPLPPKGQTIRYWLNREGGSEPSRSEIVEDGGLRSGN